LQGHCKVADDDRPVRPVEIATEATVQLAEELIRSHWKIKIGSIATALECCHGLAYSIMHYRLKFRKVPHGVCPENLSIEKKLI
jgi:hypothetical protein